MFNYIFYIFPQFKRLPHFCVKLWLCGVNSTHLASSINSTTFNVSSNAKCHNKQKASHHTRSHNKYEASYSRSHNMTRAFYSRTHNKTRASYPRSHSTDKPSHSHSVLITCRNTSYYGLLDSIMR